VLYPNVEILKVPGDGKSFSRKDARLVVGYSEDGEYSPVKATPKKKSKSPAKRKTASKSRAGSGMQGFRR
jgi:hypothetical protein